MPTTMVYGTFRDYAKVACDPFLFRLWDASECVSHKVPPNFSFPVSSYSAESFIKGIFKNFAMCVQGLSVKNQEIKKDTHPA